MAEMLDRRVLTSYTLNSHEVLRLTPPATLTPAQVQWLVAAFGAACRSVNRRHLGKEGDDHATVRYARRDPRR
jgi:putrescine aminotransferase